MMKTAVAIMCKNEESGILSTLYSIKNYADIVFIYDTGSTDKTIERAKKFCDKNDVELRLLEGQFVDFSTSRNVLLNYIDEFNDIEYVLLMDVDDILVGGDKLRETQPTFDKTNLNILHSWTLADNSLTEYYNTGLIKVRDGWKYTRKIHEVLMNVEEKMIPYKLPPEIHLKQDRRQNKSTRFYTDLDILLESYHKNKNNPNRDDTDFFRDIYYLGQTNLAISELEPEKKLYYMGLAEKWFSRRADKVDSLYREETYNAMFFKACINDVLGRDKDTVFLLYMKAFEFMPTRMEPLLAIAEEYYQQEKFIPCFMYINFACRYAIPEVSMNINKYNWDYTRWRLMAVTCFRICGNDKELFFAGIEALEVAIENAKTKYNKENPLDIELLKLVKAKQNPNGNETKYVYQQPKETEAS